MIQKTCPEAKNRKPYWVWGPREKNGQRRTFSLMGADQPVPPGRNPVTSLTCAKRLIESGTDASCVNCGACGRRAIEVRGGPQPIEE